MNSEDGLKETRRKVGDRGVADVRGFKSIDCEVSPCLFALLFCEIGEFEVAY